MLSEISVGLLSTKGPLWNSRDILRYRNLAASEVEVIAETTRWGVETEEFRTGLCRTSGVGCQREAMEKTGKESLREGNPGWEQAMKAEKETFLTVTNNCYMLRRERYNAGRKAPSDLAVRSLVSSEWWKKPDSQKGW